MGPVLADGSALHFGYRTTTYFLLIKRAVVIVVIVIEYGWNGCVTVSYAHAALVTFVTIDT